MRKFHKRFCVFTGLLFLVAGSFFSIQNRLKREPLVEGSYEMSSESTNRPYGSIESLKKTYEVQFLNSAKTDPLLTSNTLSQTLQHYNKNIASQLKTDSDPIDAFISQLPESYRRHFSLVHRSFSIQQATPMSPRVIMYGPDGKILMTFNAGKDSMGKPMEGGEAIEVIEFNDTTKNWDFSELLVQEDKAIQRIESPAKCAMCHAGTPKPVLYKLTPFYKNFLKPIFPQYPFWPGFYGSANDIVAVDSPQSKDTIMRSLPATIKQVTDLTFDTTEELYRLRNLLNTNTNYTQLIADENEIHKNHFKPFMDSIKNRKRYRHLITLKDLYPHQDIPEVIANAPFRRTFDKEYGHYLLRPNFYLSTILTFYHAQTIASQILKFPEFQKMKFSFLARKYNCGLIEEKGLKISDLDPSFDLIYPNQGNQDLIDKQYLLAYQYNVVYSASGGKPHLPLHSWNLEANEDIASYHYGNVFSDLNELVLWNIATELFPEIKNKLSRRAAEDRHYQMPTSDYFKFFLDSANGFVSRMNNTNYQFATSMQSYYGNAKKFTSQPVSIACNDYFIPEARKELSLLSQNNKDLPHEHYPIDEEFLSEKHKVNINYIRHACESCHTNKSKSSDTLIKPRFNVDWYSETYHKDLHNNLSRMNVPRASATSFKSLMVESLSEVNLPIPYGFKMPYARRPLGDLARLCDLLIIENSYKSPIALKGEAISCRAGEENSLGCRCKALNDKKEKLFNKYYSIKK